MTYLISEIKFDTLNSRYVMDGDDERNVLKDLSKINIFIGSNNSGKSQFLRSLFSADSKNFLFFPKGITKDEMNNLVFSFKNDIENCFVQNNIKNYGGIMDMVNGLSEITYLTSDKNQIGKFLECLWYVSKIEENQVVTRSYATTSYIDTKPLVQNLHSIAEAYSSKIESLVGTVENDYNFKKVYIPTLRGLRGFNNSDFYRQRTINDYFSGSSEIDVFTGLDMYDQVKRLLLGNLRDREIISEYQNFLSNNFFDGEQVVLIPKIDETVLHVKIGYEIEQPIFNLGDGIQQIIIITFALFSNIDRKVLFFIEEPELFLHPGLQRRLLDTMMDKRFAGCQYFLTTHSNHFLDMTLDIEQISIYTFRKVIEENDERERTPSFLIENVSNEDNQMLELLGVKNSSVFLSNCTIWVEGITDRYYIRKYFEIYQNTFKKNEIFKEDYHYSFVEYGGGNITHWSFLSSDEIIDEDTVFGSINVEKVCGRLFLISDKDSEQKFSRHEKLRSALGERYYCLECKEIENLLTETIIKNVVAEYEKIEHENLVFKIKFNQDDYRNVYLGQFIEENLESKRRRGKYSSDSGTVSNKVDFCKRAVRYIRTIDDMSEEAIKLCERIFNFIKSNNM